MQVRTVFVALASAVALVAPSLAEAQSPLVCGTTTQITFSTHHDQWPQWEPGGERITTSVFGPVGNVPRHIGLVNSDGTGYQVAATLPALPWGTFLPQWGPGNTILSAEHNIIHEYLSFDVSKAPFTRIVGDGSDAAFTRKLFIPGGAGGGWIVSTQDGSTVLWRYSSSGGGGTQQIRRGTLASLTGQGANGTGTILQQITSVDHYWGEAAALSPDGSLYINTERTSATTSTNLVLRSTATGAVVRMITNDASATVSTRGVSFSPDGSKIAFARITDGQWDLYVENLDGTDRANVTNTPGTSELYPTWGPDGKRLAFNSSDGTYVQVYVCHLDGLDTNQAPEITVVDPLVLEGNMIGGYDNGGGLSAVAAGVSAIDPDDDEVTLANDAPAVLPLGDTVVTWTATDPDGAESQAEQTVRVQDTTGPTVNFPMDIEEEAPAAGGGSVAFVVTATDLVDPAPAVVCSHASGSSFPVGTTTVSCTATDASGNETTVSFDVTLTYVPPPPPPAIDFDGLITKIEGMGLPRGIANALLAKVRAAAKAHARGNLAATLGPLGALLNQIDALDGKMLTPAQAASLRECTNDLIAALQILCSAPALQHGTAEPGHRSVARARSAIVQFVLPAMCAATNSYARSPIGVPMA